jgi:hypothetical protein
MASEFSVNEILQGMILERQVRQQAFQFRMLGLELLQSLEL